MGTQVLVRAMDPPLRELDLKSTANKKIHPLQPAVVFKARIKPVHLPVVWIPVLLLKLWLVVILVYYQYQNQPICTTTMTICPSTKIGHHLNKYHLKSNPESYPLGTNLYHHQMRSPQL